MALAADAAGRLRARARLRARGRRADRLDHRRRQHGAVRSRPPPGRRDPHQRRGAPGPARAARPRPAAQRRQVRVVPFDEIANAVSPATRLVACSHVSWVGGKVVDPAALKATGVPFLLDAAQAVGAVPVDVHALGCDFYAGSGQKWLSRSGGLGLPVRARASGSTSCCRRGRGTSLGRPGQMLEFELARRTRRGLTTASRPGSAARGRWLRWRCSPRRDGAGCTTAPPRWPRGSPTSSRTRVCTVADRGRSTLVSWEAEDPDAEVARLSERGIVVRSIPSPSLVRASVGAWTPRRSSSGWSAPRPRRSARA